MVTQAWTWAPSSSRCVGFWLALESGLGTATFHRQAVVCLRCWSCAVVLTSQPFRALQQRSQLGYLMSWMPSARRYFLLEDPSSSGYSSFFPFNEEDLICQKPVNPDKKVRLSAFKINEPEGWCVCRSFWSQWPAEDEDGADHIFRAIFLFLLGAKLRSFEAQRSTKIIVPALSRNSK